MRAMMTLGISSAGLMALLGVGCLGGEDSVEQTTEALVHGPPTVTLPLTSGATLFKPFTVFQNCTLTVQTSGATSTRDPVLGLIMNNGTGPAFGSADTPCHRGTPTATDGYTTKAFSDNFSGFDARASWKNTSGGAGLSVFAVGFLKGTNPSYGNLTVSYSISGCTDPTKNTNGSLVQSFQASGVQASLAGNIWTQVPRPGGGPNDCLDPVLYELDPTVGGGSARCNDDCVPDPGVDPDFQSCVVGNSAASLWYFSDAWYASGFSTINK